MDKRRLGHTDLYVTPIGLGINWIDTAAGYGKGHAEEIVGRAIAGRRDEVVLATKCGILWKKDGSDIYGHLKAESVRREVERSLGRLNVEVIDLYQIHWPLPDEDIEEGWAAVCDLVKEGKIRYGGVSNFNVAQLERTRSRDLVASLQPPYSMLERGIEEETLSYCGANRIGVIVYSPMQAGLLTGRMTKVRVANFPGDDWRKGASHFQEPALTANLQLVEGLRSIAERNGRPVSQLAIAWVLRGPELTAAIVGARRASQIEETAGAADWSLSADDIAAIDALLAERGRNLGAAQGG